MEFLYAFPLSSLSRVLVCSVLYLALCCPLLPRPATAQEHTAAPIIWQSGPVTVIAIQDRPGSMDISLFSGPATPEQRAAFFPNGKAAASITAFLIRLPSKNVLVDTGFGDVSPGVSALPAVLAGLAIQPEDIDLVLMSHMHMDHAGGLLKEKRRAFPNAKVAVAKPELEYWLQLGVNDPGHPNAMLVREVVAAYGTDFLPPFAFDGYVLPGVKALDASGHTPGHTAFLLKDGDKSLLIVGDLVHAAAFQFAIPEECAKYDIDREKAVAARKRFLNLAAEENIPLAGMHMPFPSYGKVKKDGTGFTLVQEK